MFKEDDSLLLPFLRMFFQSQPKCFKICYQTKSLGSSHYLCVWICFTLVHHFQEMLVGWWPDWSWAATWDMLLLQWRPGWAQTVLIVSQWWNLPMCLVRRGTAVVLISQSAHSWPTQVPLLTTTSILSLSRRIY